MMKKFALSLVLFALAGCNSLFEDPSTLSLNGKLRTPANVHIQMTVVQPGSVRVVTNEEIINAQGTNGFQMSVGNHGTMKVTVLYTTVPSDTILVFDENFKLNPGNAHGISTSRLPAGLSDFCFGCTRSYKLPFRGSEKSSTDSLFVGVATGVPCKDCVY